MDTRVLALFRSVARLGSFAAVARANGVDPSAVSRGIASLEAELSTRLLERSTRSLALTEAGERYLARISPLLDELDRAADNARVGQSTPKGTLRLSASVAFGEAVLVPLISSFRNRYPELALDLVLSDAQLDLVAEGIDLAVRLSPAPEGNVIRTRLMDTRYRVVATPECIERTGPFTHPRELSQRDCLRFDLPGFRDRWMFRDSTGQSLEVPVGGSVVISSATALRRAALTSLGPALLADWLISNDLASGQMVDLFPTHEATSTSFETAAWLIYPSRAYTPEKVRAAISFLKRSIRSSATAQ